MSQIVDYSYNKGVIDNIREWHFGTNWPAVYIMYNDKQAYIGETTDLVKRTSQHLAEEEFKQFTDMCVISNKTYNKSVALDLESFLIKYIGADGSKKLTNANQGIVNHNYFYREAYEDDFKDVWNALRERGIASKSLVDIENSELFKYSPYKTLNEEQQSATYEILNHIYNIDNAKKASIVQVVGGAGTGKTILAVYLVKLLVDFQKQKSVWKSIDDAEEASIVQTLARRLSGIKKIGFVVPMVQLRTTIQNVFETVEGLSKDMVLAPEDVIEDYYDVLIVDEAHRLYRRKNLPGGHIFSKFDDINSKLMGDSCNKNEDDLTELDWIIRSSRIQVLFYDDLQAIRVPDIGKERFAEICRPHLYKYIELQSQMRCKGGNGYYEYVKKVLESTNLDVHQFKSIPNYNLHVCDSISELFNKIKKCNEESSLCKIVAGPGWKINDEIIIEGHNYCWASGNNIKATDSINSIYSIHKIQGFDLNTAGVIFGKEIYYNPDSNRIEVNKNNLMDNFTKPNGEEAMRQYLLNIYLTLMTRGINGTFIYAMDDNLRNYLKIFFDQ